MKRGLAVYAIFAYAFSARAPPDSSRYFSFKLLTRFAVWESFSLQWYRAVAEDGNLIESSLNSLIIAIVATAVATIIGTLAAYGLWKRGSAWLSSSMYLSLVTPEIVTGASLLALFQWIFRFAHLRLGMHTAGHPGARRLLARICGRRGAGTPAELRPHAGGSRARSGRVGVWRILSRYSAVPCSRDRGSGHAQAFAVSIDDYVITSLVAGVDSQTLPMVIYAMARRGVNPALNAVSTLVVFGLGMLIMLSERMRKT